LAWIVEAIEVDVIKLATIERRAHRLLDCVTLASGLDGANLGPRARHHFFSARICLLRIGASMCVGSTNLAWLAVLQSALPETASITPKSHAKSNVLIVL